MPMYFGCTSTSRPMSHRLRKPHRPHLTPGEGQLIALEVVMTHAVLRHSCDDSIDGAEVGSASRKAQAWAVQPEVSSLDRQSTTFFPRSS